MLFVNVSGIAGAGTVDTPDDHLPAIKRRRAFSRTLGSGIGGPSLASEAPKAPPEAEPAEGMLGHARFRQWSA